MTFADHVIRFNQSLELKKSLPPDIRVMNPFREYPEALEASTTFYKKYYADQKSRFIILGINPGRLGAGVTGIPFTDTKRLEAACQIRIQGNITTHEPSSVYVYDLIDRLGGPQTFYSNFYINSVCPLGFVKKNTKGREVNFNYYDSNELTLAVSDFIQESLHQQLSFGIRTEIAFCLGNNKNINFLQKLNDTHHFFDEIVPLEHPRYIMQYKLKEKETFLQKHLNLLQKITLL